MSPLFPPPLRPSALRRNRLPDKDLRFSRKKLRFARQISGLSRTYSSDKEFRGDAGRVQPGFRSLVSRECGTGIASIVFKQRGRLVAPGELMR